MRKLILTAVAFAAFGGSVGTAQAHLIGTYTPGTSYKALQSQAKFYEFNAKHALGFLKPWNDISHWQILSHRHWEAAGTVPEPSIVLWHRRMLRNALRDLEGIRSKLRYFLVPHYSSWLCIHRYEGAWTDSGDPYWGGLQMDRGFMSTYGSDMIKKYGGYANVWSPLDQMIVAERAYSSGRGFYPWPNTARYCGLI